MKSWSELTEKEKETIIEFITEFQKIFDVIVEELQPLFEFLGEMIDAGVIKLEQESRNKN